MPMAANALGPAKPCSSNASVARWIVARHRCSSNSSSARRASRRTATTLPRSSNFTEMREPLYHSSYSSSSKWLTQLRHLRSHRAIPIRILMNFLRRNLVKNSATARRIMMLVQMPHEHTILSMRIQLTNHSMSVNCKTCPYP